MHLKKMKKLSKYLHLLECLIKVLIIDDELNITTDIRPLIRLSVSVIVGDDKNKEMGSFGGGGRRDLNYFDDKVIKEYAKNAVFQAITNLNAQPAPAGGFLSFWGLAGRVFFCVRL